jgi:Ribonuclease G/E
MEINTEKCEHCKGTGYIITRKKVLYRCKKCLGLGKLDWVEKVVGPKQIPNINTLIDRCYESSEVWMLYDIKDKSR